MSTPSSLSRARRFYWQRVRRYCWEICQRCGRPATRGLGDETYWFAPNPFWNDIEGGPNGIRCAECFERDCRAKGVGIGWLAAPVGDLEAAAHILGMDKAPS